MIADAFDAALAELRALAESTMADLVKIERPGTPVTDPETGVVTTPRTLVYEGKGKVLRRSTRADIAQEVASSAINRPVIEVGLPIGCCHPRRGDIVTILASAHDPSMAGSEAVIDTHPQPVTRATKLRVTAEALPHG